MVNFISKSISIQIYTILLIKDRAENTVNHSQSAPQFIGVHQHTLLIPLDHFIGGHLCDMPGFFKLITVLDMYQ